MISIKGLDKAAVLAALYNASFQLGMGVTHRRGQRDMTIEEARLEIIKADKTSLNFTRNYFDYLHGRVLKVSINGDELDPSLYDRDVGQGAAERAINTVRVFKT